MQQPPDQTVYKPEPSFFEFIGFPDAHPLVQAVLILLAAYLAYRAVMLALR